MNRRRWRLVVALGLLAVVLALLTIAYVNYRATRSIGFTLDLASDELLDAPEYLYSFGGTGADRLSRPLGVLVAGGRAYVTDAKRGEVLVYTVPGRKVSAFGKGHVLVPLYIAKNPKTNEFWVTDRVLRSIEVFDANGKWLRTFDPKLPKDQLAKFDTGKSPWSPVALAFAPDGTLYVTETTNGHRLLQFDPTGKFVKSTGTVSLVANADEDPEAFGFPNSIKVLGDEVWVADSNNRRLKVYSRDLEFKRFVPTAGLPRGLAFLPRQGKEPQRLVVVDTLSHDATIWTARTGKKVLNFGTNGVLDGQFSYPNDTSIDSARRIFITDTGNSRVQVWGWPEQANPIPTPSTPLQWLLCLSPLLLLPLLLLARRRPFHATADFVQAMYDAGQVSLMPGSRRRWFVSLDDYEVFKDLSQGGVNLGELLNPMEHSESDAQAFMQRFVLEHSAAVALALAVRSKVFCTENPELRRLARVLELDVVNRTEFLARFAKQKQRAKQE